MYATTWSLWWFCFIPLPCIISPNFILKGRINNFILQNIICEGWHFTDMWENSWMTASFFYKARFGLIKVIYFPKVPVPNQESELLCICVSVYMCVCVYVCQCMNVSVWMLVYMCVSGINFASLFAFSVRILNCSDSVVLFFFFILSYCHTNSRYLITQIQTR
jgi:hypothetical protein